MGVLIDGVWQEQEPEAAKADPCRCAGRFERAQTAFRNWVTPDGRPGPNRQRRLLGRSRAAITSMCRSPVPGRIAR